ncbi:glycoside hydrolase family 16 protein [Ruficoccus sp. ZRK36]|uniref:glycoside hydrolase family 16 protein n=1 Tax=Ruficoccus sp. ZRK36 TaxID=2866311 RepID=UPI001C72B20F|nr:glycoside hydrolase family 16 protein [Ruficoccus sp. ZRK36]QYY34338.1 glycoside hydrolase family 16 protein [Ruficoccus sp. ZRK36]
MKSYQLNGHADSLLPENKNWKLVWNDEFDGEELDESKWNYRLNFWGRPSPTFTTEGVEVDDSKLRINLVKKDGEFYSAHLQTGSLTYDIPKDSDGFWPFGSYQPMKFLHRYGFYEIRCRLPKNPGWHAAFWLQSPCIGAHPDPRFGGVECDIMENYKQHKQGLIGCGNGWGGYGKDSTWHGHFWYPYEETEDGWHRYAVDWSPDGYVFYADGKEVGVQKAPVSEVEQYILVSTECHGYHHEGFGVNRGGLEEVASGEDGFPSRASKDLHNAVLPDFFEVDYVRVFDAV